MATTDERRLEEVKRRLNAFIAEKESHLNENRDKKVKDITENLKRRKESKIKSKVIEDE